MNKAKKTFIFIPSELTEYHIWRNVLKSNSTVYLLGYTLPCNVHNSTNENNNNEVVLILGFYNLPSTENNQICPYCYTRIYSEDRLHICARSLRKYKFESSYIKKYNPLSDNYNNASNIWISIDMNTLPSSLKHGIMMKYARGFNYPVDKSSSEGDSFNRWMCSIMQNEIGQPLNHLIQWLNKSSGGTDDGGDWPSSIQHQHKVVNCQPERRHFLPTTSIMQCCTKIINKCVNFSYTLSLIKYHFDTAKSPPPSSSSITSSVKKCSTNLLKNNNDSNNNSIQQKKEKDNVSVDSSTRSIRPYHVSCLIPDASLSMIGAIQLLILVLCLITVPYKSTNNHNHSSHYYNYDDNEIGNDMGNKRKCCIQESPPSPTPSPTRQSPSSPPPRRCCREYTTSSLSLLPSFLHTTTNRDDSSSPVNWLPNDLNCKIIPTLGLFYLDEEEENYTSKLSPSSSSSLTVVSSSSSWFSALASTYLPALILYNSTNEITKYVASSGKIEDRCCWMNFLYRCVEYFTCELTRLLLWLESGKPAGLKMNLHLAHLMGQFFLYHILAWRSYVTFIIYILFIHVLSILQQFTEVDTFNVYFLANLTTIICLIFSTVYLLATTPTMSTSTTVSNGSGQSVICLPLIIRVFVIYFSIILRLMLALLTCLLLDIIELITLHLTSFYIYATHLLRLQLRTISASWRLCRNSSKWNPLRHRVDKIPDMYIDPNEVLLSISSLQKKISLSSSLASLYSAPSSSPSSSSSSRGEDYGQEKKSYVGDDGEQVVVQGTKKSSEQRVVVVVQNKKKRGGEEEEDTLYKFVTNKQNSDMLFDQLTRQKCGVYLDRLLVSTLLGLGIGLCLFSTTIAFYITFTCIQLFLLLVKNILKCTVWFIMDFPLESIVLWTCNSPYYKTKLIIEAPKMNSKHFKCLRLKVSKMFTN
uniref:Uncharacterized protein n=1 Tax=Trichobilharzia regenti TaxID=157069 RepID=A0AA85INU6_TRIRE|nr:unnamed protein product [Trichobilharzia regenti]